MHHAVGIAETQHQTAMTTWILGIIFDELTVHDDLSTSFEEIMRSGRDIWRIA
jgi:hypothetical protein